MSELTITCWQCEGSMTLAQRGDEDGQCPHCGVEVDLEDYLIAAKAEAQALREEVAALRKSEIVGSYTIKHMAIDITAVGEALGISSEDQEGGTGEFIEAIQELQEELAALRARVVVVPERKPIPDQMTFPGGPAYFAKVFDEVASWNACLDELARLNGKAVSEGLLRGLAAFSLELVRGAGEGGSFDGGEIQESAEQHGLLTKQVMQKPCCGPDDGYCSCAYEVAFPTECYQVKPELNALLGEGKEVGDV